MRRALVRLSVILSAGLICSCGQEINNSDELTVNESIENKYHLPKIEIELKISEYLLNKYRGNDYRDRIKFSYKYVEDFNIFVIYYMSEDICGSGGCKLSIVSEKNGELTELGLINRVVLPIRILKDKRNGYPVFSVVARERAGLTVRAVAFDRVSFPRWPEDGESWEVKGEDGELLIHNNSKFVVASESR